MDQESTSGVPSKDRILFVDDDPALLSSLKRMLRHKVGVWDMSFLDCPLTALNELASSDYDAVVTDVKMPGIDGLQLLRQLRQQDGTEDVPVIVLTGAGDRNLKRTILDLGATDLLNKPVEAEDLLARLNNVLRLKDCQDQLKYQNELLEKRVKERTNQLEASRLDVIWRLGKAAEFRDEDTGNHILRVGYYSRTIAEELGLDKEYVNQLFLAAPLHDIGKLGIPDSILLKKGPLTNDEWIVMQKHCKFGETILQQRPDLSYSDQENNLNGIGFSSFSLENPLLDLAASIALTHHEKWNGTGYPQQLSKDSIPIEGRIVAVADVFDALTTERPYKPAYSEEKALKLMNEDAEQHFDPDVLAAFNASLDRIRAIHHKFLDTRSTSQTKVSIP